jgi:hypothetical protein
MPHVLKMATAQQSFVFGKDSVTAAEFAFYKQFNTEPPS